MYKVGNIRTQKYVQTKEYAFLRVKWAICVHKNIYERGSICFIYV